MQHNAKLTFTGRLEVISGPMFSGKTSELVRRLRRHSIASMKCFAIKYAKDIRYSTDSLSTHDNVVYNAEPTNELTPLLNKAIEADVIGIDEAQFYPDILPFVDLLRDAGKTVIVTVLDMTFKREAFMPGAILLAICDDPVKLKAVCVVCKKDAAFSKRLTNEESLEVIGGSETYVAVCLLCYETATVFQLEQIDH
jgi:thymidine kinase